MVYFPFRPFSVSALPEQIGNLEIASFHLKFACCFTNLVTAELPFTVKTIDCLHETGPRKGAWYHPAVYGVKVNRQYCWDILLFQQLLDGIIM